MKKILPLVFVALFASTAFAQQSQLTDEQILARVEQLQKELDELRALLKQRTPQPPGKPTTQPTNPITTSAPSKFRFGGYIQLRAFDDQLTTNAPKRGDQFNLRRARLELTGDCQKTSSGA
jgi:hypothetical protein